MDQGASSLFGHDVITSVAKAHSKSRLRNHRAWNVLMNVICVAEGQVLLAWALARKLAVIPKSSGRSRLVENLGAADVQLTAEDIERISAVDLNLRVGVALFVLCKATNCGFLDPR